MAECSVCLLETAREARAVHCSHGQDDAPAVPSSLAVSENSRSMAQQRCADWLADVR
jgi:hypothetical protein